MSTKSAVLDDGTAEGAEEATESGRTGEQTEKQVRNSKVNSAIARGRRAGDSAISVKTLVVSGISVVVVAALVILGWQVHAKAGDVDRLHQQAADNAHAEQIAQDYATGAADMGFQNLDAWQKNLTKGTTPELANRLTQAAASMKQIITPLQWTSTAKPIAAKVLSSSGGVYSVDCFVSVMTKNSQTPDGIQSTATYKLTIDSNHNWMITDISGIDSALPGSNGPK